MGVGKSLHFVRSIVQLVCNDYCSINFLLKTFDKQYKPNSAVETCIMRGHNVWMVEPGYIFDILLPAILANNKYFII